MSGRFPRPLRRAGAVLGVLGLALLLSPVASSPAGASGASRYRTEADQGAVTKSETVERTYIDDGKKTVVDKPRKVTLHVSETQGLRSLQLIHVSWTGAHPTGGLVADQNSDLAQNEEYPMAIFECRGTDTAAHPISPDTCWTQYADERFTTSSESPAYPAWRSDAYATKSERAAFVDQPTKLTSNCNLLLAGTTNQRWVPFVGADHTDYPGGPHGCQGQPPEASPANVTGSLSLPSNETFGVTDAKGDGSTDFDIFTGEDHASLGCSQTVACSLVAVPVEGIDCDPAGSTLPAADRPAASDVAAATADCEQTGRFAPGQVISPQQSGEAAVDGALWWSASNWRNRISVPLSFAPADNVCSTDASKAPIDIYGSELMIQATTSWAPHFCLNSKLFTLDHVQTPEPQARSLLQTDNIEAAYTSDPPDASAEYPNPTVNAPTAVTGFGIAYDVDGPNGTQVGHLNLDARLLAKLLTESYPDQNFVKDTWQDPQPAKDGEPTSTVLRDNPLNITDDPEFQALNPNIPQRVEDTASTLLTVSSDSDVTTALSNYINSDPEARAWLNGKPDPWGMRVNPNYKGIKLPVDNWPLLDSYEPLDEYQPGRIDCLYANPVPYLPLVAAPTSRLANIGQDMQFALAQSQTVCVLPSQNTGSLEGAKMVAVGRESAGTRMMLGVVSLGDAEREGLSLASLESQSSVSPSDAITSTAGRTFVAPSDASLRAAADTLKPDTKTGVWPLDYSKLRTSTAGAHAYPGTMIVYTAVPTDGLPSSDATDLGKFLYFVSDEGQKPGTTAGDLPAGYLPMTDANGLGQLADYTSCAANAVADQKGKLPSLTGGHCADDIGVAKTPSGSKSNTPTTPPSTARPSGTGNPGGGNTDGGGNTGGGSTNGGGTTTGGGTGPTTSPTAPPSSSASAPSSTAAPTSISATPVSAATPRIGSGFLGLALPLLFAVAILGGLAALVTRMRSGRHGAS
ncbi:hypothetical protein [Jatrophihabitans endophyticus]|uniref:hypothetical protein n=1 Tax=Jatrophihabitans endophyticus TaxID=1206085 RepID=UPI0019E33509|nr:hypothetical protein [Jatrophihabitans endophyticus]MBE7188655.1 hypothetical protein [Jatrophihabitans endophyticus]